LSSSSLSSPISFCDNVANCGSASSCTTKSKCSSKLQTSFLLLESHKIKRNNFSKICSVITSLCASNNDNDGGDDNSDKDESKMTSVVKDIYGERPLLNFEKKSLLFDTSNDSGTKKISPTSSSSPFLALWQGAKATLPPIITGAYNYKQQQRGGNENGNMEEKEEPVALLYNVIFVRVPTIVAGFVYIKNELTGHPFTIDVGYGPFDVNPVIVLGLLGWILR